MTWQLDWSHALADLPRDGLRVARTATPEETTLLAAALEVLACERLEVGYDIEPLPQGRYLARGQITAVLEQSCVVTLAPVRAVIEERFDIEFWPTDQLARPSAAGSDHSSLAANDPEPIENHRLAIGRVVYELLVAAVDPYPRAAGAEFVWAEQQPETGDPERGNPFAALAKWKADRD
jgi:hypothetical protein